MFETLGKRTGDVIYKITRKDRCSHTGSRPDQIISLFRIFSSSARESLLLAGATLLVQHTLEEG